MPDDDFIVSIHALDRFQERFPSLWTNDDDVGMFIYRETMDAIDAGRIASVPPLELADHDLTLWKARKSQIVWEPKKSRGYVLVDGDEGLTVATVLSGKTTAEARSKLYGGKNKKTTGS